MILKVTYSMSVCLFFSEKDEKGAFANSGISGASQTYPSNTPHPETFSEEKIY